MSRAGTALVGVCKQSTTGATASGTITFSVNPNPADDDTVTLNGRVITFVSPYVGTAYTCPISSDLSGTLIDLVTVLGESWATSDASLNVASYSASGTEIKIQYKTTGTAGNAYTLAASAATPSGATLTGGMNGPAAPTGTLVIGPQSGTYPGVCAYFQERLFFANSLNNPDTVWASQDGSFSNFDTSVPAIATDAVTASPWTEEVNGIQWLIPMPGGLIAFTGLRAWQLLGEGSYALNPQPLTPDTVQAQPQSFNGCSATVQPIVIDFDVVYVQAIGNSVYDLSWNFWVNIYTGADLTLLSSHLFKNQQILQWCWARQPQKVIWGCRDDGTMLSLTYLKEQEVYGWARHDTQGFVVSVASIREPPVDAVYMIVQRYPTPAGSNGIYVMERMDNRIWNTVEDTWAVDSAVSNPLTYPNTPIFASAAFENTMLQPARCSARSSATST